MSFLYANCSECGRSYGARRLMSSANYCSAACKSKAYRTRKKQVELAKRGTLDLDTYQRLEDTKKVYGFAVHLALYDMYEQFGAVALNAAIDILSMKKTEVGIHPDQWMNS